VLRLLLLFSVCVWAENVKQGDVVRVTARAPAESARMQDRTIRLFPQATVRFGLMPVPADQKPGKYRLEILNSSGAVLRTREIVVRKAAFLKQNVKLEPRIEALQPAAGELESVAAFRHVVTDVRYWHEPFTLPVPGCMTSPFGAQRYYNGKRSGRYHGGLDQRGSLGEPVHAIADGVVRLVHEYNVNGNVVGIDHGQGLGSMYLHLSKFAVTEGTAVKAGDAVGYVGSTGRSTAPHLHWSIYANGVATNPTQWVKWNPCAGAGRRTPGRKRRSRR
jgi:murein DD-endopeptidase MepM/ murein hydrolase activator NlpD